MQKKLGKLLDLIREFSKMTGHKANYTKVDHSSIHQQPKIKYLERNKQKMYRACVEKSSIERHFKRHHKWRFVYYAYEEKSKSILSKTSKSIVKKL